MSIREMLFLILVFAMGFAWWVDHVRLSAALTECKDGSFYMRVVEAYRAAGYTDIHHANGNITISELRTKPRWPW